MSPDAPTPRSRTSRIPRPGRRARAAAAIALVCAATLGAQLVALSSYGEVKRLSVATIGLSADPGHRGALSLYVPLVDWGVRFDALRVPAELRVDVRSIDRSAAERVARAERVDVSTIRSEARDAIASYLLALLAILLVTGLVAGAVVALALRSRTGPRLRTLASAGAITACVIAAALAWGLPPRGELDGPEYFAHGADIPRALQAVEAAGRSQRNLSEELDAQLVGLARLVLAPGERTATPGARRLLLASDVHNNALVLPSLRRAADGAPLFMAGDLTDRGSQLETAVAERFVAAGNPFVFVSGNHDSTALEHRLADAGAIVLTRRGRLLPGGGYGAKVVRVAGLRVAGYDDPFMRRTGRRYRPLGAITGAQQRTFDRWVAGLGQVDVVMVHEPALARVALRRFARYPPQRPIAFLVGHTHKQSLDVGRNLVVLDAGTAGGGGTGNLAEHQDIGMAILTYRALPTFRPLAADLVTIAPGSGAATARHEPLDLSRRAATGD